MGVPTVGGEVNFHRSYNGNILVNAMCVGLARQDKIFLSAAKGAGNPVVYIGSKTGRDGIHGATMASAEFNEDSDEKRPTVQVGDPFTEKLLLEACLELMATDAIIAIQDMGAAGLTSSSAEMADKGGSGIELNLDHVPQREENMTAYDMMLSESQERMLAVLKPGREAEAERIFRKWELDFAVIGITTNTGRLVVKHKNQVVANMPVTALSDAAPVYDRPYTKRAPITRQSQFRRVKAHHGIAAEDRRLARYEFAPLGVGTIRPHRHGRHHANPGRRRSRRARAQQQQGLGYQHRCFATVLQGRSVRRRQASGGGDLAQFDGCGRPAPGYYRQSQFRQSAETRHDVARSSQAVDGIAEAARALDYPVISGNCSLYNETNGEGILPTPAIGGVGLMKNANCMATIAFKREGDAIVLIGQTKGHLGQSIYLREIEGKEDGATPSVDLAVEKRNGDFVRGLIEAGRVNTVHDLSDGGLLVSLAEMGMAGNIGADIALPKDANAVGFLYGEDQARYLLAVAKADANRILADANSAGVPAFLLGTTGGDKIKVANAGEFRSQN